MDKCDSRSLAYEKQTANRDRLRLLAFGLEIPGHEVDGSQAIIDQGLSVFYNFQQWDARIRNLSSSDNYFLCLALKQLWTDDNLTDWEKFVISLSIPQLSPKAEAPYIPFKYFSTDAHLAIGCIFILVHKGLVDWSLNISEIVLHELSLSPVESIYFAENIINLLSSESLFKYASKSSLEFGSACQSLEKLSKLCSALVNDKHSNDYHVNSSVNFFGDGEAKFLSIKNTSKSDIYALEDTDNKIGVLHHVACSGGTIISQCIAAMEDVCLLSEVHPFNRYAPEFNPSNPLVLYEKNYGRLPSETTAGSFTWDISLLHRQATSMGKTLILRDHTHSEFFSGPPSSIDNTIGTTDCLATHFYTISILTVRHPLDSFLSLANNGWDVQFMPNTLDEYCRRYIAFLERYREKPIYKYEDFCRDPDSTLERLCIDLHISYCSEYRSRLSSIKVSGNSGRSSSSEIKPRPRRPMNTSLLDQIRTSKNYKRLCDLLGYSSSAL